jgi:membrane protease YdiL (CAAX protease family)
MKQSHALELTTAGALIISALAATAGIAWLASRGFSIPRAVLMASCGAAVLGGMLMLGVERRLARVQKILTNYPIAILLVIGLLWGLYALYSVVTKTERLTSLTAIAVYLTVPFILLSRDRGVARATTLDAAAILWIWLPIEFGIIRRFITVSNVATDFSYSFTQALAMNMGIVAFAAWRRFSGIGYRFRLEWRDIAVALLCFVIFAVIAIPLGFTIHFIRYSYDLSRLLFAPASFIGIYLFIAVPEELLFRGLIQNWCERCAHGRLAGLILASIVFGASHLNNGPPIPNYRYFLMASIAGVFYGLVWQRTGTIAASAITHALVDTVWSALFR